MLVARSIADSTFFPNPCPEMKYSIIYHHKAYSTVNTLIHSVSFPERFAARKRLYSLYHISESIKNNDTVQGLV